MIFGSVCSGIEAASTAWELLGWRGAWFSEIEPFPSAVLAHHWTDTPNLGDFTTIRDRIASWEAPAPEVLVGGTPCQAFSVAGLRQSMGDSRGQLTLEFVRLANGIDAARSLLGIPECIVVWENVPGVLNTPDNAFGCFLAGLAGEDDPLLPPGGRWSNAGRVLGPSRAVAWRILDAQYFGVAQRRRRVFVVASARDGFDPTEILFEFDGVRRDSAPSRETGKGFAPIAGTLTANSDGLNRPAGNANEIYFCVPVAPTIPSRSSAGGGMGTDFDLDGGLVQACAVTGDVFHTLRGEGFDASEDGTGRGQPIVVHGTQDPCSDEIASDRRTTITCNHEAPIAVYSIQAGALRTNPNSGPNGVGVQSDHAYTLEARAEVQAVCVTGNITHTLKAEGFDASEDGTGRGAGAVAVAYGLDEEQNPTRDFFGTLKARTKGGGFEGTVAFGVREKPDLAHCLRSGASKDDESTTYVQTAMQVRRITPAECERLQGFPDGHTLIPWRGKPAEDCPDGPRYKALGNSMAVPVMRWIGERIEKALAKMDEAE